MHLVRVAENGPEKEKKLHSQSDTADRDEKETGPPVANRNVKKKGTRENGQQEK